MKRAIPHVVYMERNVRRDEEQVDSAVVQERDQLAGTMIGQRLNPAKEHAGLLARRHVAVAVVVQADPRIADRGRPDTGTDGPNIRAHLPIVRALSDQKIGLDLAVCAAQARRPTAG